MGGEKRVFTRDEFVSMLMDVVDDVSVIGESVMFVESVLRLQNDMSRPVYILAVDPDISVDDIKYIDGVMVALGVACCLVPRGVFDYVGEVDSESFGVRNMQLDVWGLKEAVDVGDAGRSIGGADGSEWVDEAGGGMQEGR